MQDTKTSLTQHIDPLNMELTRDLLNRVKYHRGAALRGPELNDLLPSVSNSFAKHGAALFPKQKRAPYEHPKVTEWKEAMEARKITSRRRKKQRTKTPAVEEVDQFERTQVALPATGKAKLHVLDSVLI